MSNYSSSDPTPLVEDRSFCGNEYQLPTRGGSLLITINFPRTDRFVNMDSVHQKELYLNIFNDACNAIDIRTHRFKRYVYEYCDSGHVHLHGILQVDDEALFYPIGLVSDYAKSVHRNMPKIKYQRYHLYSDKAMYKQYCRYRSPQCCVQYVFKDDTEAIYRWFDYMDKEQSTNSRAHPPSGGLARSCTRPDGLDLDK